MQICAFYKRQERIEVECGELKCSFQKQKEEKFALKISLTSSLFMREIFGTAVIHFAKKKF